MIILEDMRNLPHHKLKYFKTVTAAETVAVDMMNALGFKWCRAEWNTNSYEYCEYPAVGSCRVYVRIKLEKAVKRCTCGAIAHFETPNGLFCNDCYTEAYEYHE